MLRSKHSTMLVPALMAIWLISLLLPVSVAGQVRYRITDLGTLGGNNSLAYWITNSGDVVGVSDTGRFDGSGAPIDHAFTWRNGLMRDLGTLGGNNSAAGAANEEGQAVGSSDTAGEAASHAALWNRGTVVDLGTLDGPNGTSTSYSINNRGQIAGASFRADGTFHAVLWQGHNMVDLGTLGGADSLALGLNDFGQIIGTSEYDDVVNPIFGFPLFRPVIWYKGTITDLGPEPNDSFGGDGFDINNRGQAVGRIAIPDAAEGAVAHAFLWESGVMRDLGVPSGLGDDNSEANKLNNNGQIVGDSGVGFIETYNSDHALLWQNGEWTDLNTLIPANSGYQLIFASDMNERGQIVVWAVEQSTGSVHAALLTPETAEERGNGVAEIPNGARVLGASRAASSPGIPFISEDARQLMKLARRARFAR